ncbi:MAG: putative baseplate assembly protein, partial [Anaerolineales bacterium]
FVQQRDPETGAKGDADLRHRHAVRLTHVQVSEDPLGGRIVVEGQDDLPRPVTQIEWAQADALPFPFCVSSSVESGGEQTYTEDISLALGNIVLVDHGRTLSEPEDLGTVPESKLVYAPNLSAGQDRCQPQESQPIPPRYRPQLVEKPLTRAVSYKLKGFFDLVFEVQHQQDLDAKILPEKLRQRFVDRGVRFDAQALSIQGIQDEWSLSDGNSAYLVRKEDQRLRVYQLPPAASAIEKWGPQDAKAAVLLYSPSQGSPDAQEWKPMRHLLGSRASARQFVVEVEADAVAYLRFGDDTFGRRPEAGTSFEAVYRVGNGVCGNVGVESIHHIASVEKGAIERVWNPLPAQGGAEPEGMESVRQMAPYAFRRQERAVTPQDYAEVAARHAQVQRAAATVRWTGSWYTHYLTVDRLGGRPVDEPFKRELRRFLERYRMAGHDLEIEGPHYVPLEIEMEVCVMPEYFRSDVAEALLRIFSARILPSGERGVFHPDNFTFGQAVYLSQLYAAAEGVTGAASYEVTVFQRLGQPSRKALDEGKLVLGRLEVARLENDPNFPEHGVFRLKLEGGL